MSTHRWVVMTMFVSALSLRSARADTADAISGHTVERPVAGGIQATALAVGALSFLIPARDGALWNNELLELDHRDRTGTMHRNFAGATPTNDAAGRASAKFTIAINALDQFFGINNLDQTLKLGLAFFPRNPGGAQRCITLTERLQGMPFLNLSCEAGEIAVSPALGTASTIADALDPEITGLCNTTPVGAGLETAAAELAAKKVAGIDQYVVLVTDGADFADSCPTPDPIHVLRDLDAVGVKTFVVGFGAQDATPQGVNPPVLNQLACAGHTAKDFATNCMPVAGGGYDAVNPTGGPILYNDASDGPALQAALRTVASSVCCGCAL